MANETQEVTIWYQMSPWGTCKEIEVLSSTDEFVFDKRGQKHAKDSWRWIRPTRAGAAQMVKAHMEEEVLKAKYSLLCREKELARFIAKEGL